MPIFHLHDCAIRLQLEPLAGPLAAADRRAAWCAYLALVTAPGLRQEARSDDAIRELIGTFQRLLEEWPATDIEQPRPGQLGFLLLTVIELVLLPCLQHGAPGGAGWQAVRAFCQTLARELADTYRLPDAGDDVPEDLLSAWRTQA